MACHNVSMHPDIRNGWILALHHGVLELRAPGDASGQGLSVVGGHWNVPDGPASLRGQPLGRAIGSRARTAIDATAGLGMDAFVMAAMGLSVRAIERNDWVAALLTQAHAHALADPTTHAIAQRLSVEVGDARERLAVAAPVDVVLLDPMFPPKRKPSAKPPKAMQALAAVVGDDNDADELLALAVRVAMDRVVVKRPRHAPHLADVKPDWSVEGKLLRFDMYRGGAPAG